MDGTGSSISGYRRSPAVTIRWVAADDARRLEVLAALDESRVPKAPLLLAFVGDELWAAASLSTGAVISDPFRPSAEVVSLLLERGRQLTVPARRQPKLSVRRFRRRAAAMA